MIPLEYNGGAATGAAEVIVIGLLALGILVLVLLMWRSIKKISVPYADGRPADWKPESPLDADEEPSASEESGQTAEVVQGSTSSGEATGDERPGPQA